MNFTRPASQSTRSTSATTRPYAHSSSPEPLTPFRWLILLGFPPEVAAHILEPEVFGAP